MGVQDIGGTFLKNELALPPMAHYFEYECTYFTEQFDKWRFGDYCLDKKTCC